MAIPQRNLRGVQDIRTHYGKANKNAVPHKAYLKIAWLEMEKERRGQERRSAVLRVRNIDVRFRDIDAEKTELLRALGDLPADASSCPSAAACAPSNGADTQKGRRAFTIRY